ncbi:MAG: hypothetical protein JSS76_06615 [Bacteroidetes bacterium]|nr:hypothetical protein [Bacteroidota bacterium]
MAYKFKTHPSLSQISEALKTLTDEGIIRTNNLVGELGEYYVCQMLGLRRQPISSKGYDATDADGKHVEIKTRREPQPTAKIAFTQIKFHYCYFIELNYAFEPVEIRKVTVAQLKKHFEKGYTRVNVKKMKSISKPVWSVKK